MATIDILKAARETLSDPARWTKGVFARDSEGHSCSPCTPFAVCWCLFGAIRKAGNNVSTKAVDAMCSLIPVTGSHAAWQDEPERTHQEVLDLLDTSIERLENGIGTTSNNPG